MLLNQSTEGLRGEHRQHRSHYRSRHASRPSRAASQGNVRAKASQHTGDRDVRPAQWGDGEVRFAPLQPREGLVRKLLKTFRRNIPVDIKAVGHRSPSDTHGSVPIEKN